MEELLKIINADIRAAMSRKALANYRLVESIQEDDLDEGAPTVIWYTDTARGIQIKCNDEHLIKTIFLYAGREAQGGFQAHALPLIRGLSFQSTREEVHAVLGAPSNSGGLSVVSY